MQIAKFDIDALLPLIIGAIWIIAQIVGAAAKKKPPPARRPAPTDGEPSEDPFADLMRRLSGVQEFKIPEPPEPVDLPAETVSPLPQAVPIAAAPTAAVPSLPPLAPKAESVDMQAMAARPAMSSFKSAMPAMKLPAMTMGFQGLEKSGSKVPRIGKIIATADKQTLRRAVLGHIILGKPRGMDQWSCGALD